MNILFFARRFYPAIGGVEKHVFEIGKRLVKKGHRVIVVTELSQTISQNRPIGQNCDIDEVEGMEVYRIYGGGEGWLKKFSIWRELWGLRKVIKAADVVHCHDVFYWYLPFRFLFPQKPIFTTFHGYESFPIKKKAIFVRKLSEKLSWGNICIGDFIRKWYGTEPTIVSYGAVNVIPDLIRDPRSLDSRIRENDNKGGGKESAVFIGRLDEQTGILTYVKALELVRDKFPNFDLLVVGDGKLRKVIDKKVKVLGFQKDPEKYFKKYHFAFVSRYLSILEAFAAKRLVFALYDNPVKNDYLIMAPFAKWIVIAENENALAEKVSYYIVHPEEEKKLIEKAYAWVSNQTWEEMVNIYMTLWRKRTIIKTHE